MHAPENITDSQSTDRSPLPPDFERAAPLHSDISARTERVADKPSRVAPARTRVSAASAERIPPAAFDAETVACCLGHPADLVCGGASCAMEASGRLDVLDACDF